MEDAKEERVFPPEELLREMADKMQFPCRIFDEQGLRESARNIQKIFRWNPGFRQYFPVKTVPNPTILRILHEEGMNALCTNGTELLLARSSGFTGSEIVFAPAVPTAEGARLAAKMGCGQILDDPNQILMMELYGELPAEIGVRYNPGGRLMANHHTLVQMEECRFGMPKQQLFRAISVLKSKGVRRIGLNAHLTGNQSNPQYLPAVAGVLFEMAAELQTKHGTTVEYCDLSGGVSYPRNALDPVPDMEQIGSEIQRCYDSVLRPAGITEMKLRTQLGSYVTGNHGVLAAKVCAVKESYSSYLEVNASTALLPSGYTAMARYPVSLVQRERRPGRKFYHVVGAKSDTFDRIALHRFLPEAETGDILLIHNVGVCGSAAHLGGMLDCAEYLFTANGTLRQIRRAETVEDYFAAFDCNPDFTLENRTEYGYGCGETDDDGE